MQNYAIIQASGKQFLVEKDKFYDFEKLPLNAQKFVRRIETLVNCNIDIISTGAERDENIIINEVFS